MNVAAAAARQLAEPRRDADGLAKAAEQGELAARLAAAAAAAPVDGGLGLIDMSAMSIDLGDGAAAGTS